MGYPPSATLTPTRRLNRERLVLFTVLSAGLILLSTIHRKEPEFLTSSADKSSQNDFQVRMAQGHGRLVCGRTGGGMVGSKAETQGEGAGYKMSVFATTMDSATFCWPKAPHDAVYELQMRAGREEWESLSNDIPHAKVMVTKTGLDPATHYHFRLRRRSPSGEWEPFTKPLPVSTLAVGMMRPSLPQPLSRSDNWISLTWEADNEVKNQKYKVEMMEAGEQGIGKGWKTVCPSTVTPGVRVKGLKAGRAYMFRVSRLSGPLAGIPSLATDPVPTLHAQWYMNRLGNELVKSGGKTIPTDCLGGKMVLLYFSAHWCPPCRQFTPMLADFYNQMKAAGKDNFEIVFVSLDREKSAFEEYLGTMPWPAIPYEGPLRQNLAQRFMVQGIPSLKVLSSVDGSVAVNNGVGALTPEVFESWEKVAYSAPVKQNEEDTTKTEKTQASKSAGGKKWVCDGDKCEIVND